MLEADAALEEAHKLGASFPTAKQFKVHAELALKTLLMRLPERWWKDWGFYLAPREKQTFGEFWAAMTVPIENGIPRELELVIAVGSTRSAPDTTIAVRVLST